LIVIIDPENELRVREETSTDDAISVLPVILETDRVLV
jgi:hypothetical protein